MEKIAKRRWQKWDANKHFICVIEFLWIIEHKKENSLHPIHYNENKKHVFVAKEDEKKCHAFHERTTLFHALPVGCLDMHFHLFSLSFSLSISFGRSLACSFFLSLRIHNGMRQVIFLVFSLLLHYSFRCHFCSIYLNCKNTMQKEYKIKM